MGEIRRRRLLQGLSAIVVAGMGGCSRADGGTGGPSLSAEARVKLGGRLLPAGLPAGRLAAPEDPSTGKADPVLWVSDEPLDETEAGRRWAELLAQHGESGFWPLLLGGMEDRGELRPWQSGELYPSTPNQRADLDQLFRKQWKDWERVEDGWSNLDPGGELGPMPFSAWPGLAAAGKRGADPDRHATKLTSTSPGMEQVLAGTGEGPYLGLVAAPDGATALSVSGWSPDTYQDPAVVVRSWQERYGVRVCALGFDTLSVAVAWPPASIEEARRLMLEHYMFSPDNFWQAEEPVTFEDYATWLTTATSWSFWWD